MFQIVVLALIQGLTEFLPVSSSGHLILIPHVFGWTDQGLEMDVALHAGTLLAACFYFWRDLRDMLVSLCRMRWDSASRLIMNLGIGTLPVVVLGVIFKQLTTIRTPGIIALMGILFGVALFSADRLCAKNRSIEEMSGWQALLIGFAQAVALIPGVSRSGISMTVARFLKFDRVSAAKFSFLLAIPAITGAVTLTAIDVVRYNLQVQWAHLIYGVTLSFFFGWLAIHGLMVYIRRYSFLPFMVYRILLGIVIMALLETT